MSLTHSPKVVTDGLVFYYDMGNNLKSWKGQPATNIVSNWNLDTGWSKGYCTDIIFDEIPPPVGVSAPTVGFVDANTDTNTYWYSYGNYASGQVPNSIMTISIYVKITGPDCQIRAYTADNSELGRVTTAYTTVSASDGWKRCEWTITIPSNSTSESLSFNMAQPVGSRMWLCAPQMETGSFATPFVAGTRSDTQAIVDLTNNNTLTANSLTYASDGTFSFNGTTDYIDTGNTFTFAQSGQFSAEVWLKILDHSDRPVAAAGIIGKGHYYDNQWDVWLYNNNSIYFETTGNPTRQGLVYLATPVLALSTWYHYVATYNNGAKSVYLNGVLVGTQTYTGPGDFSNTNNVLIGRRFGDSIRSLRGSVSVAKIYNRALSAAEVRLNFNALRGRYGL